MSRRRTLRPAPPGASRSVRFAEIDSELEIARNEVDAARRTLEAAQSAFDVAGSAETETRARERSLNRHAARLSALAEARARLNMSRDEAATAKTDAEKALNALAPSADLEAKLAQVRGDIAGKRSRLAEVQAEQQAIVREAELADRRLATLATDKKDWVERQQGARNQIATLEQRTIEAKRDRTELENAPKCSAKSGMR